MDLETILLWFGILACVYMACNIGANDVANAMGTSVGAKSLTFRQAVLVAAVAEFAGAVFVGGHVSDTVRKGMVDPNLFCRYADASGLRDDFGIGCGFDLVAYRQFPGLAGFHDSFHCRCCGGIWVYRRGS